MNDTPKKRPSAKRHVDMRPSATEKNAIEVKVVTSVDATVEMPAVANAADATVEMPAVASAKSEAAEIIGVAAGKPDTTAETVPDAVPDAVPEIAQAPIPQEPKKRPEPSFSLELNPVAAATVPNLPAEAKRPSKAARSAPKKAPTPQNKSSEPRQSAASAPQAPTKQPSKPTGASRPVKSEQPTHPSKPVRPAFADATVNMPAQKPPQTVTIPPQHQGTGEPIHASVSRVSSISYDAGDIMMTAPFAPQQRGQDQKQSMKETAMFRTQSEDKNRTAVRGIEFEYVDKNKPATPVKKKATGKTGAQNPAGRQTRGGNTAKTDGSKDRRGGPLLNVLKALLYIVFVFAAAGMLSYFAISVGNDVFALVKSDAEYTVVVPEGADIDDIADILAENGIIKYPTVFKIYSMLRKDNGNFVAGEYSITPAQDYDDLLYAFKPKKPKRTEVSVTIPEGYTVDDIIDLFVSKGMGTREGFVDAIQNYDFEFWFLDELQGNMDPARPYRLEGYLFPDTYYFYSDSSEETILYKMLSNFNAKFPEEYKIRCEELGMTVDQVITLASIIQMEAKYADEYGKVSSVFHNRMNKPRETNGKLESDATIQYALDERKQDLTEADLNMDSPYNTYLYAGLPPGPISNPCLNAINWAMYPDKTDYYYFVATKTGRSLFAETLSEHNKNVASVRGE